MLAHGVTSHSSACQFWLAAAGSAEVSMEERAGDASAYKSARPPCNGKAAITSKRKDQNFYFGTD